MSQSQEEAAEHYAVFTAPERVCPACGESTAWSVDKDAHLAGQLVGEKRMLERVLELLKSNEADAVDAAHPKGVHPREWAEWMEGGLQTVKRKERSFKRGLADEEMGSESKQGR